VEIEYRRGAYLTKTKPKYPTLHILLFKKKKNMLDTDNLPLIIAKINCPNIKFNQQKLLTTFHFQFQKYFFQI